MTATEFLRGPSVNGRIASLESSEERRSPAPGEVGSFIIANLSAAPTYKEVREADQSYMLIPVQRVNTPLQNEGSTSIVTFFDAGLNISIVRTDWAERAGLNGLPISRRVHVAGGHSKEWKTKLYQVPILKNDGKLVRVLALGMETITEDLEAVNITPAARLFSRIAKSKLRRPVGYVDLLICIHVAEIQLIVADAV